MSAPLATPESAAMLPIAADPDGDLDAILAELGAEDGYAVLQRQTRVPPIEWEYLDRVALSDFSADYVKAHYGGGRYRAKLKRADGSYRKHATFSVAGPPKTVQLVADGAGEVPHLLRGSPSPELSQLVELVKLQVQQTAQLTAALAQGAQPKADPFELALKIAEVSRAQQAPAFDVASILGTVREMLTFSREIGSGESDSGIADTIKAVALPLVEVLKDKAQVERQTREVHALPAALAAPPATPVTSDMADTALLAGLRPFIPQLVGLARRRGDPELYAEVLLDQVPEVVQGMIRERAADPAFVEIVAGAVSELQPYRDWWTELLTNVRALLLADDEDESDEGDAQEQAAGAEGGE